jgi:hypothetical protein
MSGETVLMTDSKENVLDYCEISLPRHVEELFKTGKSGNYTITEYVLDTEKLAIAMKLMKDMMIEQNTKQN